MDTIVTTTGEHPAHREPLSESTPVRLGLVLLLAGALCTAAVAVYRVGEAERRLDRSDESLATAHERIAALTTSSARAADQLAALKQALDRIDSKLDRLLESRTSGAVYRQPRTTP